MHGLARSFTSRLTQPALPCALLFTLSCSGADRTGSSEVASESGGAGAVASTAGAAGSASTQSTNTEEGRNQATASLSDGSFAAACDTAAACQADLICAQAGVSLGLCSRLCDNTDECQLLYGTSAECEASACVLRCKQDTDCPGSSACDSELLTCVTPPEPPSLVIGTWHRIAKGAVEPVYGPTSAEFKSQYASVEFDVTLVMESPRMVVDAVATDQSVALRSVGLWWTQLNGETSFHVASDCAGEPWHSECRVDIALDYYTVDASQLTISGFGNTATYQRVTP